VAIPPFARATVVPREAVHPDLQLRQMPLLEKERQCLCWDLRPLVTWMGEKFVMLPEKLPVAVEPPQILTVVRSESSTGPLMVMVLELRQLVTRRDSRRRLAKDFGLLSVRARRCSRGPGPFAS
jgi:hypothetical protein